MPVMGPAVVENCFSRLRLPFGFSPQEREALVTRDIIDLGPRVMLFPTPIENRGLNLQNLHAVVGVNPEIPPSFFDHPWYQTECFFQENCEPGWHAIQMDVDRGSLDQPYNYHLSLLESGLALPSAVEVVLMLFFTFLETGEHLLVKKHTWCRDEATLGRMVTVGAFGRNGVFISGQPPTFSSRGLGICGKVISPLIGAPSR